MSREHVLLSVLLCTCLGCTDVTLHPFGESMDAGTFADASDESDAPTTFVVSGAGFDGLDDDEIEVLLDGFDQGERTQSAIVEGRFSIEFTDVQANDNELPDVVLWADRNGNAVCDPDDSVLRFDGDWVIEEETVELEISPEDASEVENGCELFAG